MRHTTFIAWANVPKNTGPRPKSAQTRKGQGKAYAIDRIILGICLAPAGFITRLYPSEQLEDCFDEYLKKGEGKQNGTRDYR